MNTPVNESAPLIDGNEKESLCKNINRLRPTPDIGVSTPALQLRKKERAEHVNNILDLAVRLVILIPVSASVQVSHIIMVG